MRVYADNAATTKLSPAAKEAMLPYFDEIYGNPSTLYTLGQEAAEHRDRAADWRCRSAGDRVYLRRQRGR